MISVLILIALSASVFCDTTTSSLLTAITQGCQANCSGHGKCVPISESNFGCVCEAAYAGVYCDQVFDSGWAGRQTGYIIGLCVLGVFSLIGCVSCIFLIRAMPTIRF